jgi:serine/threonine protein kinase
MCIKMELMDTNLEHWLETNPDKIGDFETTKFITKEMLDALAFIHSNNIVHRDLKPNNILLNVQPNKLVAIKIGDFGLSREMKETDTSLTVQVGGRNFSSPEMERGDKYDLKTDIFSVGLICLVMLHKFENLTKMERAFDDARLGDLKTVTLIESSHGRTFSLLRQMLDRRSINRPTAADALKVLQAP